MPSDLPPGALTDRAPEADPLARARELVAELLEMVSEVRGAAAELEAERDELRRQVAEAGGTAAELEAERDELRRQVAEAGGPSPEPASDQPSEGRAHHGDLARALAPVLGAPRRPRSALSALLGGDTA